MTVVNQDLVMDPWAGPAEIDPTPERSFSTVMITGHRPKHLTDAEYAWSVTAIHAAVWRLRSKYGMAEAISGLALGADTVFACAALSAGARLAAYVPFLDQAKTWPAFDQELWAELRRRAAREVIVAGVENPSYDVKMLHARNDAMLSDTAARGGLVVALFKPGTPGGTASAVAKAQKRGQPMLMLDPGSRSVRRDGW